MQFLNIIVANGKIRDTDRETLFPDNEKITTVWPGGKQLRDILDALVILEVFPSRSQARKNWRGETTFPDGWTTLTKLGKKRKKLYIWNPTE